jgi:hypothetical protein
MLAGRENFKLFRFSFIHLFHFSSSSYCARFSDACRIGTKTRDTDDADAKKDTYLYPKGRQEYQAWWMMLSAQVRDAFASFQFHSYRRLYCCCFVVFSRSDMLFIVVFDFGSDI